MRLTVDYTIIHTSSYGNPTPFAPYCSSHRNSSGLYGPPWPSLSSSSLCSPCKSLPLICSVISHIPRAIRSRSLLCCRLTPLFLVQKLAWFPAPRIKCNHRLLSSGVDDTVLQQKKRRIRFSSPWDVLLFKTFTAFDARLAPHFDAQSRLQDSLGQFISSIPSETSDTIQKLTRKTLNDSFKKLFAYHLSAVRTNAASSGILEVRGER